MEQKSRHETGLEPKASQFQDGLERIQEVDDPRFGQILLLRGIANGEIYFMKQKDAFDINDHNRDVFQAKERLKLNNYHILPMVNFSSEETVVDGQNLLMVKGFYEYPSSDLYQQIKKRASTKQYFNARELMNLFTDILQAIVYLQKQRMVHGDIRPKYIAYSRERECYQLMDRLGDPSPPHQAQHNNFHSAIDLYLSPALFIALAEGSVRLRHNPYKSDLFSLALVVMEAGLLQSVSSLFTGQSFDSMLLDDYYRQFTSKYGDSGLLELMKKSLALQEARRPDPAELLDWARRSKLIGSRSVSDPTIEIASKAVSQPKIEENSPQLMATDPNRRSIGGSDKNSNIQSSHVEASKIDKIGDTSNYRLPTNGNPEDSHVPDNLSKAKESILVENYQNKMFISEQRSPSQPAHPTQHSKQTSKDLAAKQSPPYEETTTHKKQALLENISTVQKSEANEVQTPSPLAVDRSSSIGKAGIAFDQVMYQTPTQVDSKALSKKPIHQIELLTRSTSPPRFEQPAAAIQTEILAKNVVETQARGTSPPPANQRIIEIQLKGSSTVNRSTSPVAVNKKATSVQTSVEKVGTPEAPFSRNSPKVYIKPLDLNKQVLVAEKERSSVGDKVQKEDKPLIVCEDKNLRSVESVQPVFMQQTSQFSEPRQTSVDKKTEPVSAENPQAIQPTSILFKPTQQEAEYTVGDSFRIGQTAKHGGGIVRDISISGIKTYPISSVASTPYGYVANDQILSHRITPSPTPLRPSVTYGPSNGSHVVTNLHAPLSHGHSATIIRSSSYSPAPIGSARTEVIYGRQIINQPSQAITTTTIIGQPIARSLTPVYNVPQPSTLTTVSHQTVFREIPLNEFSRGVTMSHTYTQVQPERHVQVNETRVLQERSERESSRGVGKFAMCIFNPETGKTVTATTTVYRDHSNEHLLKSKPLVHQDSKLNFGGYRTEGLDRARSFDPAKEYRPLLPPTSIVATIEDGDTTKAHKQELIQFSGANQTVIYPGSPVSKISTTQSNYAPISRVLNLKLNN